MKKKIAGILIVALIAIQFFRPAKNISATESTNAFAKQYAISSEVQTILEKACYDCHSNNTVYPWYAEVQPVSWWLNSHILDAKEELNFDEFGSYAPPKQYHKLEEAINEVNEGEMPLFSYTIIHTNAKLSEAERKTLVDGFTSVRENMQSKYPMDSLIKSKK